MEDTTQPQPQTIKIEVVNKQEEKPEERRDPGIDYKFNPEYHRICDELGMDKYKRQDQNVANKVAFLYDWAKETTESEDGTAISLALRDLVSRLGVTFKGELLVNHLYHWARLEQDGERLRIKEFEKDIVEKQLQVKQKIQAIEPKIKPEELEARIKEGMKGVQKDIKRQVKSHITQAINKGIKEALSKASQR